MLGHVTPPLCLPEENNSATCRRQEPESRVVVCLFCDLSSKSTIFQTCDRATAFTFRAFTSTLWG